MLAACGASEEPAATDPAASTFGKADDPGLPDEPEIAGHWAKVPVERLAAAGVITEAPDAFTPAAPISRVHWIRLLSKAGLPVASAAPTAADKAPLTLAQAATLLCQAMGWSAAPASAKLGSEVVQGARIDLHPAAGHLRAVMDAGALALEANPHNLEPDRLATRGEAAAMLYLALRSKPGSGISGPIPAALARHRLIAGSPLTEAERRWNRALNLADSDRFFARWLDDNGTIGTFSGAAGRSIAYVEVIHPQERAALLLVPGFSESFRKHAELAYDFYGLGYSIYSLDHRGQAASGRFLSDWNKAYVDDFERFVDDLKGLIDLEIRQPGRTIYAYAHSLGGGITTRYLQRYPTTGGLKAVVLSSPMHQMKLPMWESLVYLMVKWGKPTDYAWGKGPYKPWPWSECTTTSSYLRYRRATQLWDDHPELRIGGQTNQWVRQALEATWRMGDDAHKLAAPILLLQADEDTYVAPWRQEKICKAAQQCTLVKIAGSRHELYQEADPIRRMALEQAYQFLLQH